MLTVGAGLLTRSVRHLVTLDHGFAADRLLAVDLYLRGTVEGDARPLFRELMAASEGLPRVLSASVSMRLPTQLTGLRALVGVVGEESLNTPAVLRPVTPRYFETIDVPVMEGRPFAATDGPRAPRVAIVNAAFVRDVLNGRAALATRVTTPLIDGPMAVVGVVGDVTPAGEPDRPALYVPVDQIAIGAGYLVVRTDGDPRSTMAALTARLRAVAPSLALDRTRRVAEALEQSRGVTRFAMQLANLFAALAVVLAMIGIYGLTAGEVTARWRELAVRLALGASRRDAFWTVLRPCADHLRVLWKLGVGSWELWRAAFFSSRLGGPPGSLEIGGLADSAAAAAYRFRTTVSESICSISSNSGSLSTISFVALTLPAVLMSRAAVERLSCRQTRPPGATSGFHASQSPARPS